MIKSKKLKVRWLFLLLSTLLTTNIYTQHPGFEWAKSIVGTEGGEGRSIDVDNEGNVYSTGYFSGVANFGSGQDTLNLTSFGITDIYIQKLDKFGDLIWAKSIGGISFDQAWSITLDNSNNVYVTGYFSDHVDFDPGLETHLLTSSGYFDVFILKLDSDGNFKWVKTISGSNVEIGYSITTDHNDNVYTTGYFSEQVDFDPGTETYFLETNGLADIFVQKLDAEGNFLWAKSIGGESNDESFSITTDVFGNTYIIGWFIGEISFDPNLNWDNMLSNGGTDIFILKMDQSGNLLWIKSMGSSIDDRGFSISTDSSGNVYSTGYFSAQADFDPTNGITNLTSAGFSDIYIQKLDTEGNLLWAKSIGGNGFDQGYSIFVDSNDCVYLTGSFRGSVDFDPSEGTMEFISEGVWDIFIQKLDEQGNLLWATTIGGINSDKGKGIHIDEQNNIYTTGNFNGVVNFGLDSLNGILDSHTGTGIFVHKLNQDNLTNSTEENNFLNNITLYPNPTNGRFNIFFDKFYNDITLSITDLNNKLTYTNHFQQTDSISINITDQPPGIFFVKVKFMSSTAVFKILLY